MWDMNNPFLAMPPDPFHPALEWILVIQHQETTGALSAVESDLKENLSLQKETDMRVKEQP